MLRLASIAVALILSGACSANNGAAFPPSSNASAPADNASTNRATPTSLRLQQPDSPIPASSTLQQPDSPIPESSAVVPAPTLAVPPTTAPILDAASFVDALSTQGVPIGERVTFSADNDPNQRLGRSGQYVAKGAWTDDRASECLSAGPGWECGGDVEIFDDPDALNARYDYLTNFATTPPIGGFYMWRTPNAIVRVGFVLPPQAAQSYDDALRRMFGSAVEQLSL